MVAVSVGGRSTPSVLTLHTITPQTPVFHNIIHLNNLNFTSLTSASSTSPTVPNSSTSSCGSVTSYFRFETSTCRARFESTRMN